MLRTLIAFAAVALLAGCAHTPSPGWLDSLDRPAQPRETSTGAEPRIECPRMPPEGQPVVRRDDCSGVPNL